MELRRQSQDYYLLSGRLQEPELVTLRAEFDSIVLGQQGELTLDVSALESVNSVVLSLLLCFLRSSKRNSVDLKVVNLSKALFDMARVGGLELVLSHD